MSPITASVLEGRLHALAGGVRPDSEAPMGAVRAVLAGTDLAEDPIREGTGGLLAVPLVAARVLGEVATFGEAGI